MLEKASVEKSQAGDVTRGPASGKPLLGRFLCAVAAVTAKVDRAKGKTLDEISAIVPTLVWSTLGI